MYLTELGAFGRVLADAAKDGAEVFLPQLAEQSSQSPNSRWTLRAISAESLREGTLTLGPARAAVSIKALLFPSRGEVSRFFGEDEKRECPERIVVGARQCDLAALRVLDHIFLEGDSQGSFKDPFYAARREKMLVVSADCAEPCDVCFCTAVEGRPFPKEGFDLNLSEVDGGLLVEAGTDRGERFIAAHGSPFGEASEADIAERDASRRKVEEALRAKLREDGIEFSDKVRSITRGREEHAVWDARAADCVECGACNFVCPTCHCFYLLDVQQEQGTMRFAEWDSCLYPKYARVAGGANPRARRAERLLNRFEKKFTFFCDTMDALACTGCGRCIEACAGKIDIRDVLKELAR